MNWSMKRLILLLLGLSVWGLGWGDPAGTARPLSLLLLPPIAGQGSPQLAISWKGEQTGQLELYAVDARGATRRLKTRALAPGMHLDGVEPEPGDVRLLAVLRDGAGRELARAEHAARPGAVLLDEGAEAGPGTGTPKHGSPPAAPPSPPPRPKGGSLDWNATFTVNDWPSDSVLATTIYDDGSGPALVIGGHFTTAGGQVVNRIARWNGQSWSALGSGMNGSVWTLAVYGGELIAGGQFTTAGGGSANRIARWDGSGWSALGAGMNGSVWTLAVHGGALIAGGDFTTAGGGSALRIARWDGSSWSALGTGMNGAVFALAVYRGELIAGGQFTTAGGGSASRIARWDGSGWSALGAGMNFSVWALTVYRGALIAGGQFTTAGGGAANRIARWDGSGWSALGGGMDSPVLALTVYRGGLIAGGQFTTAGGGAANRIARWDGSGWSALGAGMNSTVFALAVHGSALIAGGEFTTAGGGAANRIARWDGSSWSALGSGLNGVVRAVAVYGGALIAGGDFTTAGGTAANRIARWDGSSWSALGSGMNGSVHALAEYGGALIAGGIFTTAGGGSANFIARWNGSSWSALGTGMDALVTALTVYGGELIAGGFFTSAGGSPANYIARWNGSSWSALGTGMNDEIRALTVYGGELIAGGDFSLAGGTAASYVARWDGSSWSALGSGTDNVVRALTVYGGALVAGGSFTIAGGLGANRIARWDGSGWSALGPGMNNTVQALTVYGGALIAAGDFTTAGGSPANRIARWDGSSWSTLGSGLNGVVRALAVQGGALLAGGDFTTAGTVASPLIAAYGVADLTVTEVTATHPAPSRAGEPVRIRVRVTASTAPTAGHITLTGAPGGSCSDLTLTPVSGTSSEAECTMRWNTPGARTLTAVYIGGTDGTVTWQPSTSAPYTHTVDAATDDRRALFVDAETALTGSVDAAIVWDDGSGPALVVGGDFTAAGTTTLNRIAKWNGDRWVPLGSGGGRGVDGPVFDLAVLGGDLIVAGGFTQANVGGAVVNANYIARWNGSSWSALGSGGGNGVDGTVRALAVLDSDLYAGGDFTQANVGAPITANRIARWNGSGWSALGSGGGNGVNNTVRALAVMGGDLLVGGQFTQANVGDPITANRIARWNGSGWSALGSGGGNGLDGTVRALAVLDTDLYAGGDFTQANVGAPITANRIARWDGGSWSALGSGGGNGVNNTVWVLAVLGGDLVVGGQFTQANVGAPITANRIARWNGSSWSALGSGGGNGVNNVVYALAELGGELYAGGFYTQANVGGPVVNAHYLARWDGSSWSALGTGMNDRVFALTVYEDALIAGGIFVSAGGVAANRIARWDGSSWSALGTGMDLTVTALTVYGGDLIAGGIFTSAGGSPANYIARWNGSSWSALGTGMNAQVTALTVYDGELIAGGFFTSAGGSPANYIARWNGSSWSALGTGMNGEVRALAVYGGELIAGGNFTLAGGGAANYIARWNGSAWSGLGSGTNNVVRALTVHGGALVAGGSFTIAGGLGANRIARWDGSGWSALGPGMNNTVQALTVYGGALIAAGDFTTAGGGSANRIARWDGSSWSALGPGMNNPVQALTVYGGALIAGGDFTTAFGWRSPYIAAWGPTTATTTVVHATSPNPSLPGQPVTLTARVSGRVAPTPGTVTFIGAPSGSCSDLTLTVLDDVTSEASCTVTFANPGPQQIRAYYDGAALPGDFGHLPSTSTAPYTHVVAGGAQSTTTAIASITPSPSTVGGTVNFTVHVTGSSTAPVDGQVTVTASSGESCTDTTPTPGMGATAVFGCPIVFATAGSRTVTASFSGSSVHGASSSGASGHTVNPAATTTSIASITPPTSQTVGVPYTVTVAVTGGSTPGGTVTVSDGTGGTCSITLPGGSACALASTSVGAKTITASYAGDAHHSPSSASTSYLITASPGFAGGVQVGAVLLPAKLAAPAVNPTVTVSFPQPFNAVPVVIVQASDENARPQALRIRNVTATGFQVLAVEPSNCSGCTGSSGTKTVHWLAALPGRYRLVEDTLAPAWLGSDLRGTGPGALLIVGAVATRATQYNASTGGFGSWPAPSWETVSWPTLGGGLDFTSTPVVLSTIQTWANEGPNLTGAGLVGTSAPWAQSVVRNVTAGGFQTALDAGEVSIDDTSTPGFEHPEVIGYVAIESGVSQALLPVGGPPAVGLATGTTTVGVPCSTLDLSFPSGIGLDAANFRGFGGKQSRAIPDGGWLRRCRLTHPAGTTVRIGLRREEDQDFDGAQPALRSPITDSAAAVAFSGDFVTTPVTLAELGVVRVGAELEVSWSTVTEVAHVGFRLWGRSRGADWRLLHPGLVGTADGDRLGVRRYRLRVPADGVDELRLEDVDLLGQGRFHPALAVGERRGAAPTEAPIDWAAIRAENAARRAALRQTPGVQPSVLAEVREDGVQRIAVAELIARDGRFAGQPAAALAVLDDGRPVVRHLGCTTLAAGCVLEFVGRTRSSRYGGVNVYTIALDPAAARPAFAGHVRAGTGTLRQYAAERIDHPNRAYAFSIDGEDPWYDARLVATTAPAELTRDFVLPERVAGEVRLTVEVHGGLDFPQAGADHHVELWVNGQRVADHWFDGLRRERIDVVLPESVLATNNTLRVRVPGDTGYSADVILLEGFRVRYPRRSRMESTELRQGELDGTVTAGGEGLYRDGFEAAPSAFSGFALTDAPAGTVLWSEVDGRVARDLLSAPDVLLDARSTRWLAAAPAAIRSPNLRLPPSGYVLPNQLDYLVIAHPLFVAGLEPLLQLQAGRGLRTAVVTTEAAYAAHGDHAPDPAALRAVVVEARSRGARYVVLVGGDSYDYHDYLGIGSQSYVPTWYRPSSRVIAQTPTDLPYVDVDGDGLPDLALGRLPVRTADELQRVVASIVSRGDVPARNWLGVAGRSEPHERFAEHSRASLSVWNEPDQPTAFALADEIGTAAARAAARAALAGGRDALSYLGHSSPNRWAFDNLLDVGQLADLERTGLPALVTQWSCWSNVFVLPTQDTMAHALLLRENRLAAAVLGATSLAEDASLLALAVRYLDLLADGRLRDGGPVLAQTHGEALLHAQRDLLTREPQHAAAVLNIALFADPAMPAR